MTKIVLILAVAAASVTQLSLAQSGPRGVSSPGAGIGSVGNVGGSLGGASAGSYGRSGSAPAALPTYTPAPSRTPGSSVGYVSGAYTGGTAGLGNPVNGGYSASGGGYRPGYTSTGVSSSSNPYSSAISGASNPNTAGTSAYTNAGLGTLPPPTFSAPGALIGAGTIGNVIIPTPTGLVGPIGPASTQPIAVPVLPSVGLTGPIAPPAEKPSSTAATDAPAGDTFATACKRFNEGQYSAVISLLDNDVKNANAPLPSQKLYIAALVADGQMSMASYQAAQAARSNAAKFFKDQTLADVYKGNPQLSDHAKIVEKYARGSQSSIEPGILAAMYVQLTDSTDLISVLSDIHSQNPDDKAWLETMKAAVSAH